MVDHIERRCAERVADAHCEEELRPLVRPYIKYRVSMRCTLTVH